jgi:hypothetical protein
LRYVALAVVSRGIFSNTDGWLRHVHELYLRADSLKYLYLFVSLGVHVFGVDGRVRERERWRLKLADFWDGSNTSPRGDLKRANMRSLDERGG